MTTAAPAAVVVADPVVEAIDTASSASGKKVSDLPPSTSSAYSLAAAAPEKTKSGRKGREGDRGGGGIGEGGEGGGSLEVILCCLDSRSLKHNGQVGYFALRQFLVSVVAVRLLPTHRRWNWTNCRGLFHS